MAMASAVLPCVLFIFFFVAAHAKVLLCPSAIFGFTDSLSDTGNRDLEVNHQSVSGKLPYGITSGNATGRYCDGLVPIDFLSNLIEQGNSVPSLSYNGTESGFMAFQGLNFGYAGATVTAQPANPYSSPHIFSHQVSDFLDYQNKVMANRGDLPEELLMKLFHQALYYIEIGGDDINFAFEVNPALIINTTIPYVVGTMKANIQALWDAGARNFLVLNMPAPGCTPLYRSTVGTSSTDFDEFGCLKVINDFAKAYNDAIKSMLTDLGGALDGNFLYYDWYATTMRFIEIPDHFGFTDVSSACCGSGGGKYNCEPGSVLCGCNSTAVLCPNPSDFMSWDGIHNSEHYYQLTARAIYDGNNVSPPAFFGDCSSL